MFLTKLTMNKARSGANSSLSHNSAPPVPPVPDALPITTAGQSSIDEKEREIERLKEKLLAKKLKMKKDEAHYRSQYEDLHNQHTLLQKKIIEMQSVIIQKQTNEL